MAVPSIIRSLKPPFTRVLADFLQTLARDGRARLPWPEQDVEALVARAGKDEADLRQAERILESWHQEAVLDLPGPPLNYHPRAALWGALMTFRAAAFICFREIEAGTIQRLLPDEPLPDAGIPEAIFSADLCLRHWPMLTRLARSHSEDDPLVVAMHRLAAQVPLSALGLQIPADPAHPLFRHAGLRQLFAERALERADHACLALPEIATFLRSKLGTYFHSLGRGLVPPAPAAHES